MESHFMSLKQFCALYACGKTKAYELIAAAEIEAVKIGGATRIVTESAKRWAARLPRMT